MYGNVAQKHGSLADRFGLLSRDQRKLVVDGFENLTGFNRAQVAPILGKTKAATYTQNEIIPSKEILEKVLKVAVAADLAYEMLGSNLEETRTWMMAPNVHFFGSSPFELCMTGQGDSIIEWLLVRTGKKAGQAF